MDKEFRRQMVWKLFSILGITYEVWLKNYFGDIGVKIVEDINLLKSQSMVIYIY